MYHPHFILAIFASLAWGKLFTDPSQLVQKTYDYIVVGAGAAGAVVAARLSEDGDVSVLLIEAGPSDEGISALEIPSLSGNLVGSAFDWNFTVVPQAGFANRSRSYHRGKVLGGSTSMNGMTFSYGSSEDWNKYADITGDEGWNWNNMRQYILKNEKLTRPADNHDTTGQYLPELHSTTGAVSISLPGFPTPLDSRVMSSIQELSFEFPYNRDLIGGDVLGIGWMFSSIGNGARSSSSTAYLRPASDRSNLDIVVNTQATKLINTGDVNSVPSFNSILVAQSPGSPTYTLSAKQEIVLSAGVIGTPVLLQLSGIGNSEDLKSVGIPTIVNNPSVGYNLSDHVVMFNPYSVNSNDTLDTLRDPAVRKRAIDLWNATRTGPLTNGFGNHYGFLRLPENASIFHTIEDPASGPRAAHYELGFANSGITAQANNTSFMSVMSGAVKITSSNPFDKPFIDGNYLSTDFDIFTMKESVKAFKRFLAGPAWKDYVIGPFGSLTDANEDDEIERYVREHSVPGHHGTATAAMSPKGASWGVVDSDLKVKGVSGLRVVDASVMPFAPNAHTQGPTYLIGERGASLIKAAYKLSKPISYTSKMRVQGSWPFWGTMLPYESKKLATRKGCDTTGHPSKKGSDDDGGPFNLYAESERKQASLST